jgi:5-methylcytosine-specific restriction endonuclease McrA
MPARGRPWDALRTMFKEECRQRGDVCWLCLQPIDYTLTGRQPRAFSADHITPTDLGGKDTRSNLKPSHYGCNSRRGNTTRGQFPTSRTW